MKLTSLIFVVAGLYSAFQPALASDNFSLWPRRPEELEQARRLMQEQKGGEAVLLLQPLNKTFFATPWTVAYQAPPSMGFSTQGY